MWADHGIDYPIERWSQVVGQAWSPSWVTELADEAGADPAASRAAKRAYHDELLAALVLRPGVAALIAAAGDADIPLAIASNSDSGWVEGVLEQLGLLSHFLAVTTIDRVAQGKPHPEPFLAAVPAAAARDRSDRWRSRTRPPVWPRPWLPACTPSPARVRSPSATTSGPPTSS